MPKLHGYDPAFQVEVSDECFEALVKLSDVAATFDKEVKDAGMDNIFLKVFIDNATVSCAPLTRELRDIGYGDIQSPLFDPERHPARVRHEGEPRMWYEED
jgi:hypothetical protein